MSTFLETYFPNVSIQGEMLKVFGNLCRLFSALVASVLGFFWDYISGN